MELLSFFRWYGTAQMQRPTCYPQVLVSIVLASCTYSCQPCVRVCMHSREPCASACVTLVCPDGHLHSCTSATPSLVNTDHFTRGWRLSIGDYKRPPCKGSGELSRHDLFCLSTDFVDC